MRAGALREQIVIQQYTATRDEFGAEVQTWATFATLRASVEPMTGRQLMAAQGIQADVTHRFTTRWITGVIPKMRISFDSRMFDILAAINEGERNRMLILMARELV